MGKTLYTYDVYDNGELILKSLTPNEIRKQIGENVLNVTVYANSGHKFRGRYTFKFSTNREVKTEQELSFEKEWNDAVAPFKHIVWVKEGGKRLNGSRKR